jgi:rhodanese-related sulfurtransferase
LFKKNSTVPSITANEVDRLVADGAYLVDVRERAEWYAGHIAGADLKPLSEVNDWYQSLPTDRQIIVYCRSGQRSAQVIEALINQVGMPNLLNLTGGIIAWAHAGLPIET